MGLLATALFLKDPYVVNCKTLNSEDDEDDNDILLCLKNTHRTIFYKYFHLHFPLKWRKMEHTG